MMIITWALERKKELQVERDQLLNNLNAIGGAIQFCDLLIQELEREAAQPPEEAKDEQSA